MCIKRKILNEYVTIDIETTGFNVEKDNIIELAVCKVKNKRIIDSFTSFINPQKLLHKAITEITGITDNMLKDADTVNIVLNKLVDFIGDLPIVVHNADYVMKFIKANTNIKLENEVIDTLTLSKKKLPHLNYLKIYTIKAILEFSGNSEVVLNRSIDYARVIAKVFETLKDYKAENKRQ